MRKQMENKICLITGGAGSIGMAAARLLAAEGAKVMLVDLAEAALRSAVADVGKDSDGKNLAWCVADVTKSERSRTASRKP